MKNRFDSFFVNNIKLDKYQEKVIKDNSKELLVVAAAGSGKTLTIIGKVKYLIENLKYQEKEILCLSFTNETVNNLKNKLSYNVDTFTFHKLALNILKDNNIYYKICKEDLLNYIVNEYFMSNISLEYQEIILEYLDVKLIDEAIINHKLDLFKNEIISFIKKIKSSNIGIHELKRKIKNIISNKDKIFLIISLKIYSIYEEELKSTGKIDFDDMIIYAKNVIKKHGIKRKYKYIIIDEYQDISLIRYNLIKMIKEKLDCNLICVGDDYQSIYGFSGCNLDLFVNFSKYYKNSRRIDIKNTYRNSYELIKISNKFIMKNPYQLRKTIYANFLLKYPIVLVYYDDFLKTYDNLLNYLYLEDKKEIMVLSRYNHDLNCIKNKDNSNIKYLTVHKSKGLECNTVILIKMSDDYFGFPSKIKQNDVISLFNKDEDIKYAEERRLFYVALTRTKEKIYIMVPRKNPSVFIKEIKSNCQELLFT